MQRIIRHDEVRKPRQQEGCVSPVNICQLSESRIIADDADFADFREHYCVSGFPVRLGNRTYHAWGSVVGQNRSIMV